MSIYLDLTAEFNAGKTRCIISSGQAVVLHRLAIMSKDGDWIIREDSETTEHLIGVLQEKKARYRFGAPLDVRWLSGGWSSHFEFQHGNIRIRTDFVSRPPRISNAELACLWQEHEGKKTPWIDVKRLAELKKTNREKDYPIIGELARLMKNPRDQLLYSRSAMDILEIARNHPDAIGPVSAQRPVLSQIPNGRNALEAALDAERREMIHRNEERLQRYVRAAEAWSRRWPDVHNRIAGLTLNQAHARIMQEAGSVLPVRVKGAIDQ